MVISINLKWNLNSKQLRANKSNWNKAVGDHRHVIMRYEKCVPCFSLLFPAFIHVRRTYRNIRPLFVSWYPFSLATLLGIYWCFCSTIRLKCNLLLFLFKDIPSSILQTTTQPRNTILTKKKLYINTIFLSRTYLVCALCSLFYYYFCVVSHYNTLLKDYLFSFVFKSSTSSPSVSGRSVGWSRGKARDDIRRASKGDWS